jgi:hypothetical protein
MGSHPKILSAFQRSGFSGRGHGNECQPDGFIEKPFDILEVGRIVNTFI